MSHHVCPFWMGYLLACPLRRVGQDPRRILTPYVGIGMTVLEVGPGMGFFTLPMARMVGPGGNVVCVDVQPKMLDCVRRRAVRSGLADRILTRACEPTSIGVGDLAGKVDFVLAFAVVHEVPDSRQLFREIAKAMKPGARCLVAEPKFHVSAQQFDQTIATAVREGLELIERPGIRATHAAVLTFSRSSPG